jgi:hypothetical protein
MLKHPIFLYFYYQIEWPDLMCKGMEMGADDYLQAIWRLELLNAIEIRLKKSLQHDFIADRRTTG